VFARCPKIDLKKCAHAAMNKGNLHCGLVTGPLESTKVDNMPKCAKDMTKSELTRYAKGFTPKFR